MKTRNDVGRLTIACAIVALAGCESSSSVTLITEEEFAPVADAPIDEVDRGKPVPDAPEIRLVTPDLTSPVDAPLDIQVQFAPAPGAVIDVDSARIVYRKGFLSKNITEKFLEHGRIDASGIYCESADLPSGKHRIIVEVGDDKGRIGSSDIRFTVR